MNTCTCMCVHSHTLTDALVHNVGALSHLDRMDVAPGTLHSQHLTVDQTNQHLPHLTLIIHTQTHTPPMSTCDLAPTYIKV